jgi:hypothetical protein
LAENGGDRCARCTALHALELASSATDREIREAYRVLVKVWHPDRFQSDPKLKEVANNRLKALNSAHVFLTSKPDKAASRRGRRQNPAPEAKQPRSAAPGRAGFTSRLLPSPLALLKFAVLACGLVISVLFFKAADSYLASQPITGRYYAQARDGVISNFRQATAGIWSQTGQNLHGLMPQKSPAVSAAVEPSAAAGDPASAQQNVQSAHPAQNLHRRELGAPQPEHARLLPYITAGLTQDEVEAIQGAAAAATAEKLVYGSSEFYFTNGKLTGWKIDPSSATIRVKLWPDAPVDPGLEYFGAGSSKSAVLVVQGTPSFFSENQFGYGGSVVYFQNNRVVSWKNDPTTVPLRIAP